MINKSPNYFDSVNHYRLLDNNENEIMIMKIL